MSTTIAKTQPKPRDAALAWDDAGPGLYDGEVLIDLGDGKFAAVSADAEWPENNSGLAMKGCARWCDKGGQTILSGQTHVEVNHAHLFSPHDAATYPVAALKKEIALLMLGEPPALMREVPQEDGSTSPAPVLDVSDEVRLNASIRHAIGCVSAIGEKHDLAAIL